MKHKYLFFDAGNTLVGMSDDLYLDILDYASVSHINGKKRTPLEVRLAECKARVSLTEYLLKTGETYHGEMYFREIMKHLEILDEQIILKILSRIIELDKVENLWHTEVPFAIDGIKALKQKGYKMAVISNADGRVDQCLKKAGLFDCFDFVIDSHMVGFEKPDKRIFELALNKVGLPAEETAYVGDIYYFDTKPARELGMKTYLLDPHNLWGSYDCNKVKNLLELAEIL